MPSWEELQTYATTRYQAEPIDEHSFGVLMELDSGRRQHVTVRRFEAFERTFLEFFTGCCGQDALSPTEALRMNAEMIVGVLMLTDEHYVYRCSVPFADLDPEEFDLPLQIVASTADMIEEHVGQDDRF
jgi:hypothetical protein